MGNPAKKQLTVIHVKDHKVIAICAVLAKREDRKPTNACETTLLEALDPTYGKPAQDTPGGSHWQEKIETKSISGGGATS